MRNALAARIVDGNERISGILTYTNEELLEQYHIGPGTACSTMGDSVMYLVQY